MLNVFLSQGDLRIAYSHDGEVSITAVAHGGSDTELPPDFFSGLTIEQAGSRVEIRQQALKDIAAHVKLTFSIDVPYRTEVHSFLDSGKQMITGVMGPVTAEANQGDITVSYISRGVSARAVTGNLKVDVVGESVDAQTGGGNISCSRALQAVKVATEAGDISLMVVGPSTATVRHGTGRITVGGVRGRVVASTDAGDLRVKAVPHDEWRLSSASGTIEIELPPSAPFEVDATTKSGELSISRDDLDRPPGQVRHFYQKANGGGTRIELRTEEGRIVIG